MPSKKHPQHHHPFGLVVGLVMLIVLLAACTDTPATPGIPPTSTPIARSTTRTLTEFTTLDFVGSGNCAICHSALTGADGQDVSIDTHWRSTMMANAATDPLWQAKVTTEVARHPQLQSVIEDTCARCHMPMAYTQAATTDAAIAMSGQGFNDPANPLHSAAMDGVSCTVCHQIQATNLGTEESFSGKFDIDTSTDAPNRLVFGQFGNPAGQVMMAFIGYEPVYGEHVTEAALCATCHTLYTPYLDGEGNIVGTFPEQTPYLEWQHSRFGNGESTPQPCQKCHMPETAEPAIIANRPRHGQLQPREPFNQHHFVGGNTTMLEILKANADELGITATDAQLEATMARVVKQLQTATATMSISEAQVDGDVLTVGLNIETFAGHKFPTGFPTRRTWLHVTVTDASGEIIFESGLPQADGSIAGSATDEDPKAYEPHYDVITSPDQVQIYESMMQNTDGEVTYTLLRAAGYIKDNRLLPQGFDKTTASVDMAPDAVTMADENFVGGGDKITYQVDVKGYTGPFEVTAELLYQSFSYQSIEDIRGEDTPAVETFTRYYDAVDKTPTIVAIVTTSTK